MCNCFRSGRVASADFGCRKVPLLQVLFANHEVARHVRFAKAEELGWHLSSSRIVYLPIMTDVFPAPDYLLNMVRYQYTSGCETLRYSCRRNGLPCSFAFGECKGVLCANTAARQDEDDNEDEQEEELALGCALKSKCSCD